MAADLGRRENSRDEGAFHPRNCKSFPRVENFGKILSYVINIFEKYSAFLFPILSLETFSKRINSLEEGGINSSHLVLKTKKTPPFINRSHVL